MKLIAPTQVVPLLTLLYHPLLVLLFFLNEKQVTKLCPNFSPDIIIGLYLLYFGSVSSGTDLIVILKFIH